MGDIEDGIMWPSTMGEGERNGMLKCCGVLNSEDGIGPCDECDGKKPGLANSEGEVAVADMGI